MTKGNLLSLLKSGDILAGAEHLSCAGQHDAAHLVLALGLLESGL
jgi:hypothetical protein